MVHSLDGFDRVLYPGARCLGGARESLAGTRSRRSQPWMIAALVLWFSGGGVWAIAGAKFDAPTAGNTGGIEFFEKEIRPLLVERCYKCHGTGKVRGGLRLLSRDLVLAGGDRGPAAVPGKPEESLLIAAVRRHGELKMPPTDVLPQGQVDRLTRWVALGLPWTTAVAQRPPTSGGEPAAHSGSKTWWAFQPVRNVARPEVRDTAWPRSEIDRFILSELEAHGLAPARAADRRTLLRRATFDLTGLPPSPQEIDAFLADRAPDAFAHVVDRLLASPAYGERWARHWLDVVRYTDYFYPDPNAHPRAALFELFEAWRYRDWVVAALNGDLPYDRFIVHQLAGDLEGSPSGEPFEPDRLVATGFLALSVFDNGDADKLKIVTDIVDDQIDVVGKAFLGLTLACARCHDHKFDPVSQRDYYGLAGIFHSTRILAEVGAVGDHTVALRVPLVPPSYLKRRDSQLTHIAAIDSIAVGLRTLRSTFVGTAAGQGSGGAIAIGSLWCRACLDGGLGRVLGWRGRLEKELLPEPPRALVAQDGGTPGGMFPGIQDVPLHVRGSYTRLGPVIPRHLPEFLGERPAPIRRGSGRLELARWIARPENPLTARVLVNRVWQHHFGRGLVSTASNFGRLGEPPSHPGLLDWLADQCVRDGWSIKRLHRRILLSAVYQQSGESGALALRQDPENRWLARMSPRRLEAEAIRDSMLAVSGWLDRTSGGPATGDLARPRRSLYVQTVRQDRGNFSSLFDAANPEQSVESRSVSTVAPQALFLINGALVQAQAVRLARRLIEAGPANDPARLDRAYRLLFGRPPLPLEVEIARSFLARARERGALAAWTDYAHVLLCSNEFIYID
jgi:hypothetical protein